MELDGEYMDLCLQSKVLSFVSFIELQILMNFAFELLFVPFSGFDSGYLLKLHLATNFAVVYDRYLECDGY